MAGRGRVAFKDSCVGIVVAYFEANPDATLTTTQVREMTKATAGTVRNRLSKAVLDGKIGVHKRVRHNAPVYCKAGAANMIVARHRPRQLSLHDVWR